MKIFTTCAIALMISMLSNAQQYIVSSPDRATQVTINFQHGFTYSVAHRGSPLLTNSEIGMIMRDHSVSGKDYMILRSSTRSVSDSILPVVPEKRKKIMERYNEIDIRLKNGLGLTFRAYNNGVAYRWATQFKSPVIVDSEIVNYALSSPADTVYYPEEESFYSHNERIYKKYAVKDIGGSKIASLPALVSVEGGIKLLITESDLYDFAGLWLKGSGSSTLSGIHPNFPAEEKETSDRDRKIIRRENYVAKTSGNRSYPWRIIGIAEKDGELLDNQLTYLLSTGTTSDFTWVKPGKVPWDWWNATNIYGVDFKSGVNTATYKYYIDFAEKYNLQYLILDEGWSKHDNLLVLNPEVNMDELAAYAKQKKIGLILWVSWLNLDKQLDSALSLFSKWDVKGIKVDFMQRDDQEMVNYYERVAAATAKYHMLVDFHGAYKPTGMQRKYPNALTREGVYGNENSKWDTEKRIGPQHNVTIPFIRMAAGPMDYTPGGMLNAQKDSWYPIYERPMTLGTRCQQLAMYVVFESPLQMLCDNPTNYYREPECMEFLKRVPTVWDESMPLDCKTGEYVSIARKAADGDWYIGAMTNWSARDLSFNLSFLADGDYIAEIYQDGINADRMAQDYKKVEVSVKKTDVLKAGLAPGGGWVARIHKK